MPKRSSVSSARKNRFSGRAIIELAEPIKRATAFNRSTDLKRRGRRLEVTIYDIHEVLIVGY